MLYNSYLVTFYRITVLLNEKKVKIFHAMYNM